MKHLKTISFILLVTFTCLIHKNFLYAFEQTIESCLAATRNEKKIIEAIDKERNFFIKNAVYRKYEPKISQMSLEDKQKELLQQIAEKNVFKTQILLDGKINIYEIQNILKYAMKSNSFKIIQMILYKLEDEFLTLRETKAKYIKAQKKLDKLENLGHFAYFLKNIIEKSSFLRKFLFITHKTNNNDIDNFWSKLEDKFMPRQIASCYKQIGKQLGKFCSFFSIKKMNEQERLSTVEIMLLVPLVNFIRDGCDFSASLVLYTIVRLISTLVITFSGNVDYGFFAAVFALCSIKYLYTTITTTHLLISKNKVDTKIEEINEYLKEFSYEEIIDAIEASEFIDDNTASKMISYLMSHYKKIDIYEYALSHSHQQVLILFQKKLHLDKSILLFEFIRSAIFLKSTEVVSDVCDDMISIKELVYENESIDENELIDVNEIITEERIGKEFKQKMQEEISKHIDSFISFAKKLKINSYDLIRILNSKDKNPNVDRYAYITFLCDIFYSKLDYPYLNSQIYFKDAFTKEFKSIMIEIFNDILKGVNKTTDFKQKLHNDKQYIDCVIVCYNEPGIPKEAKKDQDHLSFVECYNIFEEKLDEENNFPLFFHPLVTSTMIFNYSSLDRIDELCIQFFNTKEIIEACGILRDINNHIQRSGLDITTRKTIKKFPNLEKLELMIDTKKIMLREANFAMFADGSIYDIETGKLDQAPIINIAKQEHIWFKAKKIFQPWKISNYLLMIIINNFIINKSLKISSLKDIILIGLAA